MVSNRELAIAVHGLAADYARILRCAKAGVREVEAVFDAAWIAGEVAKRLPEDEEGVLT